MPAAALALLAAACFGAALVVLHQGLKYASSYAGAKVSLSTTFVLWWALAPFMLDLSAWHAGAAAVFAIVGLFYPGAVTVLTNESNRLLGPTVTGTISSTAPLFATALAVTVLGEPVTAAVLGGGVIIVAALALMSWRGSVGVAPGWRVLLPLSTAALRGLAQTLGKIGLALWPSAFAATLISYTVSGAGIWAVTAARAPEPQSRQSLRAGMPWFMAGGVLNGCAVLLLYHALHVGRVSVVAPLVALYPLFTMGFSAIFLREELTRRTIAGALLAVAGVVLLVWA